MTNDGGREMVERKKVSDTTFRILWRVRELKTLEAYSNHIGADDSISRK
jgi:hypothetical protein